PVWIRQAEFALAMTNYPECASLLNQALARDSMSYEALLLRGRLALAQGEATNALKQLENLRSIYEKSPQVHYHLALAYLLNKDPTQAIASLTRATAINKNLIPA